MRIPGQLRGLVRSAEGGVSVFALFLATIVFVLSGVAVDYANGIRSFAHLRAVVDSVALAAAQDLPDETQARDTALAYAASNAPAALYGTVISGASVTFGAWDKDARSFSPGQSPANAVRVIAERNAGAGNAIVNMFMGWVGRPTSDIRVEAVALGIDHTCVAGGFFSRDSVTGGSDTSYTAEFCLYGDDGVEIVSNNAFSAGSRIEMPDTDDFTQGDDNTGVIDALTETSRHLPLIDRVTPIVNSLTNAETTYLPSWVTNGPFYLEEIEDDTALLQNSLYIVEEEVDLGSAALIQNIVIVAGEDITTGSNIELRNVILASEGDVQFGNDTVIGAPDVCTGGQFDVTVLAEGDIGFGTQPRLRGALIAAEGAFDLGLHALDVAASYVEADNAVTFGRIDTVTGCSDRLTSDILSFSGTQYTAWALVR